MDHKPVKSTPKLFFLHLLSMFTLYATAISFIVVVFQVINIAIPDPLKMNQYYGDPNRVLRTALSFLIVMMPVYVGTVLTLSRMYRVNEKLRDLRIRKWLVYLTLFVAAVIILITIVILLNSFLNGDFTLHFFLKLLAVFFVAGSVFGYYFLDMKKDKDEVYE